MSELAAPPTVSTDPPGVSVRTMNKGRRDEFERVFLTCPHCGREDTMASSPIHTRTARRWLNGDFSGEWCGLIGCLWRAGLALDQEAGDE